MGNCLARTGWALAVAGRGPARRRPAGAGTDLALLQGWATAVLSGLDVRVRLAAPVPSGGQLWVSNHLSWIDPLVYLSLRPSRVLAKAEVAGYPGIGSGARRAGLRFVRRENLFSRAFALRHLRRDLQAGEGFLVFPEGTTTDGGELAPFYSGALRMAHRLGVTVLPLRLASADPHYPWVGDAELLPHLTNLAWTRHTEVSVHPGQVLDPAHYPDEARWIAAIRRQLEPQGDAA
jgi:1-acyl-sn-glycerol-3-phosphate acyltransferase